MKHWYESKTMWACIGLLAIAVWRYYETQDFDKSMQIVFEVLAILGIRTGIQKIK
jgi:hypothetical protein